MSADANAHCFTSASTLMDWNCLTLYVLCMPTKRTGVAKKAVGTFREASSDKGGANADWEHVSINLVVHGVSFSMGFRWL
jgi:hypothetical protein